MGEMGRSLRGMQAGKREQTGHGEGWARGKRGGGERGKVEQGEGRGAALSLRRGGREGGNERAIGRGFGMRQQGKGSSVDLTVKILAS